MYNTEFLLSVSFAVNNGIAHSMYMAPLIKTEQKKIYISAANSNANR